MILFSQSLIDKAKRTQSDEVTVKPKYLIPDTNCFLDSFKELMSVLESGHFVIAIPLTGETVVVMLFYCYYCVSVTVVIVIVFLLLLLLLLYPCCYSYFVVSYW